MSNESISSIISLVVAIAILIASFFQWWDITYGGGMILKLWVKILFSTLIIGLLISLLLIILQDVQFY